jgi:hypothetical protein
MVNNYYEQLVLDRISELLVDSSLAHDPDYAEDIACVALNQLPARYVRHAVDVSFYMTREERREIDDKIDAAISKAVDFINQRRKQPAR